MSKTIKTPTAGKSKGLKVKTFVKAGGISSINHNQPIKTSGLKVKTFVKAGGISSINHNRSVSR